MRPRRRMTVAPERSAPPMLVSVVLPVRNRFDLAGRAIASVAGQTHRPIELIVVDDASSPAFEPPKDAAGGDLRIRTTRMETNIGPGAAREGGRRIAAGAFIAYLDSDDYWAPSHLASALAALRAAPEAAMAYCAAREMRNGEPGALRRWSDEPHGGILPALLWGRPWHTSACVWKREMTDAIGPWLPIWHYEDYEYDCRAGCLGAKLVHLPEPTCFVQADAPGRQSESPAERRRIESFGTAILSMAECLRGTAWVGDERVRERMRGLLLSVAAKAADVNVAGLTRKAIGEAWRWPGPMASLAVATGAGMPLLWLSGGRAAARFFRWARPHAPREIGQPAVSAADGLE